MGNINMWLKLIKKTSKICHSLNGNVFKFKDMIPGVNALPQKYYSTRKPLKNNYMLPSYTTIPNRELNKITYGKNQILV